MLYASAYFLPLLLPLGAYFLPSNNLLRLAVLPTAVVMVVGGGLVYLAWLVRRIFPTSTLLSWVAIVATALLCLIAIQSLLEAAGFHWQDRVPRGHDLAATQQAIRFLVACVVLGAVWAGRRFLAQLLRLLSSLGFAFGAIAIFRLLVLTHTPDPAVVATTPAFFSAFDSIRRYSVPSAATPATTAIARRVVWVIFDETDFEFVYGGKDVDHPKLENFERLKRIAVFAEHANSPASATLYSIPALLTGVPIDGVTIGASATLAMHADLGEMPFAEGTSIFGALAEQGLGASVLGFFHPYCKLFSLQRCDSFAWPNTGGLTDALWVNIPSSIAGKLGHSDGWGRVTRDELALLPQYLAREDALTFVHLNMPHLPAVFADAQLNVAASADPLTEYSRNLALADQTLGVILRELEKQPATREVLLIVSTDHWLRNRWYRPSTPEVSRPIPLLIWKVGDTQGTELEEPVSTIHTAAMILDYLSGEVSTQADIVSWWQRQVVFPAFIGPNT